MASSSWWSGWMIRSKKPWIPASNGKEQVDPDESLEKYFGKSIFEHGSMFWSASPASCGTTIPDSNALRLILKHKFSNWTNFYQFGNWASWAVASPPFSGRLSFSTLFMLFGLVGMVSLLQLSLSKLEMLSKLELLELKLLELKLLGSWAAWAISACLCLWAALLLQPQLQKAGPGSPIKHHVPTEPKCQMYTTIIGSQ